MQTITSARIKKLGKKAATIAIGIVAATALALGSLVDSPEELFQGAPQAQVVMAADDADERAGAKATSAEPAQKETLRDKLRRLFLSQPSIVRGVVLLPFWAVGKAMLALFSLLLPVLTPLFQVLLGVLLNATLLFGLLALVLKLLFPNLRLRDLFTKRNILLLAAGSLLLSVTDTVLRTYWEDYRPISIAIKLGVGLLVLALLSWRIFGKRIKATASLTT